VSDNPTLANGADNSDWVLYLQQVLQSIDHWHGDLDGIFGDDLEQAVHVLQDANGLTQTGVVDDEVWALLERLAPQQAPDQQASDQHASGQHASGQQASASSSSSYPDLHKAAGDGEWVQYLQQVMQSIGHWAGAVDGVFSDELEQAVRTLQGGNGLAQSGVVNEGTWTLLDQLQQQSAQHAQPTQHTQPTQHAQSAQHTQPAQQHTQPTQHAAPAASIPVDPGLVVAAGGHEYVIYTDEVRQGGSPSWRARNPGNIRNGDTYGAYHGKHITAGASGHFAVFPDEATGFAAIKSVLHHYGHVTVAQAMSKYAPAGDGANDPDAYARHVAGHMGVPVTTFVDQLTDAQMTVFATAIRQFEGWTAGHTFALTDPALPDAVKKGINGG
jgi:peptidoglycan hydrolase-like protein with peptidoglycan-binding domain